MSIASELTNLEGNIGDAYDAVNDMSGIIPQHKNMANLDQAIRTIPQSTGPTPGDGVLTIQKNGSTVQTFTANSSSNKTANITVPTKTSDLTNDSGFISEDDLYSEVCGSDTTITFQDTPDNAPLSDFKLKGETSQNGTPTPDAPVAVQTVTGENTLTISDGTNTQSYEVNLGDIELCKIGTYQDSIYKSGSKWYVRKEIGAYTFDGSENWVRSGRTTASVFVAAVANISTMIKWKFGNAYRALAKSNRFIAGTTAVIGHFDIYNGSDFYTSLAFMFDAATIPDIAAAKSWIAANKPVVYGILATPTDTEITNEALVAQLEAILSQGYTYAGTNNITTVIAAGNAQGELEICYTKTLLPIATETNLGLVQIGSGLSITPNGVLSATGGGAAQNEPIVVWLDWGSVGTDLEILGTATAQFMDGYTSSATAVGSSFFAGALSDNKQVVIRTGSGLPVPGTDWARETLHPMQVNYEASNGATIYFWHETMFVRAQCPNSGTTWTFTKLSV